MNADDDYEPLNAPVAKPIDPAARHTTDFLGAQIRIMRMESPEIWERIDSLCDGDFDSTEYKSLLINDTSNCEQCGYQLYGNTSGICPECGTPVHMTPEARRMISIRIFDILRTTHPDKWATVSERLERERMARVKQELAKEGNRRDEIRRNALQNWLDRKRGGKDQ